MRYFQTIPWFLVTVCVGCAAITRPDLDIHSNTLDAKMEIQVAVFRGLMNHDDSTGISTKYAIVLCVDDRPPPAIVLTKLNLRHPLGLPCDTPLKMKFPSGGLYVDGDIARPAIQYEISDVMVKNNLANVRARFSEGMGVGVQYKVVLHMTGGHWQVTGWQVIGVE